MSNLFQLSGDFRLLRSNQIILQTPWSLYAQSHSSYQVINLEVPRVEPSLSLDDLASCSGELSLTVKSGTSCYPVLKISSPQSYSWIRWWLKSIWDYWLQGKKQYAGLFLILPTDSGYILRSDILRMRLLGSCINLSAYFHNTPGQALKAMLASQNVEKLDEVFATTAAAFLMQTDEPVYGNKTILDELAIRLDLHWIGEGSFVRRRIALVDGGFSYEFRKDIFAAAAYLGIDLVVFDSPNHWIQKYESEQEPLAEFVPLDMALDHNLPHRITIAIKNYPAPFDGITTFTDSFLCATAQAAELLSLPTGPIEAFEMTVNKTKMREMFPLPIVRDMAEGFVPGCNEIVKPSEGGGSRAVFLARNDQERLRAKEFIKGLELVPVVEQYLDGPEVDVNIALQDGKVLFAEVSDNLPTMAEGFPSKYGTNSWLETGDVFPSGLPDEELAKLCNTTSAYLLKLGFRSGVFHCEARVLCSKFGYSSSETPYPRLRKLNKHIISNPPEVAIIEINARAPGNVSNKASMYASGIDFYALQFLAACGDNARFTSLSQPFSRSIGWWGGGFIGAEIGGTFTPQIMFEELKVQAPELMEHVFDWTVYLKPGDQFSDPVITGKYLWVAWFIVHSRKSRKNLESISEKVRGLLSFEVLPKGT